MLKLRRAGVRPELNGASNGRAHPQPGVSVVVDDNPVEQAELDSSPDLPAPPGVRSSGSKAYRWSFISLAMRVGLQAISGIVIARQIGPGRFGTGILIVSIYGVVSGIIMQGANGTLLIRSKIPRKLFRGIVLIDLGLGLAGATGCLTVAALSHSSPIRWGFIIAALGCTIQIIAGPALALTARSLHFKRIAMGEIGGALIGTSVGITVSSTSHSLLSLPLQMVLIDVGIFLAVVWSLFAAPHPITASQETDVGYAYALQMTANMGASTGARNADNYLVAAFLGHAALGEYVLAYRLMMLPVQNIAMVLTRVLIPRLRHLAADAAAVKAEVRKLLLAVVLVVGASTGAALPFIHDLMIMVFGKPYEGAIRPTEALLLASLPQCCVNVASCVLSASGKGRTQLRLTTTALAFAILAVLIGNPWGITGVTITYALLSLVLLGTAAVAVDRNTRVSGWVFAEAVGYYALVTAAAAAFSWGAKTVLPTLSIPSIIGLVLAGCLFGGLLAFLVQPTRSRTAVGFWWALVIGRA
jgi:O-antigen/teichoic acid export membrane protein